MMRVKSLIMVLVLALFFLPALAQAQQAGQQQRQEQLSQEAQQAIEQMRQSVQQAQQALQNNDQQGAQQAIEQAMEALDAIQQQVGLGIPQEVVQAVRQAQQAVNEGSEDARQVVRDAIERVAVELEARADAEGQQAQGLVEVMRALQDAEVALVSNDQQAAQQAVEQAVQAMSEAVQQEQAGQQAEQQEGQQEADQQQQQDQQQEGQQQAGQQQEQQVGQQQEQPAQQPEEQAAETTETGGLLLRMATRTEDPVGIVLVGPNGYQEVIEVQDEQLIEDLAPGAYTVAATGESLRASVGTVEVTRGQVANMDVRLSEYQVMEDQENGSLRITVAPGENEAAIEAQGIELRGSVVGPDDFRNEFRGDAEFPDLAPGAYVVLATAEGFGAMQAVVEVQSGQAATVNVNLEASEQGQSQQDQSQQEQPQSEQEGQQ